MKFKNAYEYIESLFKAEKLIGLEIGLQREFTIIGELAEQEIQVLNNIWGSYYPHYSGFHKLCYDSNNNLCFEITIDEDIKDYQNFPGDEEEMASIVTKTLNLENIVPEDPLHCQVAINLEIDFYNLHDSLYSLKKIEVITDYSETLKEELESKLNDAMLSKIKNLIVSYIKEVHINEFSGYFDGFYLELDNTEAWSYRGSGSSRESLKSFLENTELNKYINESKRKI